MKDLIFSSFWPDVISYMFEEAEKSFLRGNDVTVVVCNQSVGQCLGNIGKNKVVCHFCRSFAKKMVKLISKGIKVIAVNEYSTTSMKDETNLLEFNYKSLLDIKKIEFHHVKIGYSCLSSYISCTRNNDPLIDDEFKLYFDSYLRTVCYQTLLHEEILNQEKPDHIYFFNGRGSESRSVANLAEWKNIDYTSCEGLFLYPYKFAKRYFHNSLPHSICLNTKMICDTWDNQLVPLKEKIRLGNFFYESKIMNKYYGDSNYTKNQNISKLPYRWNENKYNIVIFNSSEDELTSIDEEHDKSALFASQIEGIRWMANFLRKDDMVDLYLRIHPNLRGVNYKYHTDLLNLGDEYSNLEVIPASSEISSYGMMLHSSLVIVFGSTIGAEAAHAGKPVINLAGCEYMKLGFCYQPQSIDELREYIADRNLKSLKNINTLKYGYYNITDFLPGFIFYNNEKRVVKILGHSVFVYPMIKLLGSTVLAALMKIIIYKLFYRDKLPRKERELS